MWAALASALGAVAIVLLVRHAATYFFLFDDFAVFGELPGISVSRILREPLGSFYRPLALLILKVEAHVFGFSRPWGPATVSVLLHLLNAGLGGLLVRRDGQRTGVAAAAGALFLAAPWAGEGVFWVSAQFDLLSTAAFLAALLLAGAALRSTGRSWAWAGAAAVAAGAALSSKELAVTLPVVALLLGLAQAEEGMTGTGQARRPWHLWQLWRPRRLTLVVGLLGLVTAAYLAARWQLLPGLRGPYGEYGALLRSGGWQNLASHLLAFAVPPLGAAGGARTVLLAAWATGLLLVAVRAARLDLARTVLRLAAFLFSLAPILTLSSGPGSIPGGRLLYAPGALLVVTLAPGLAPRRGSRPGRPSRAALPVLAFVLLAAVALISLRRQQRLWGAASALARHVVEYPFPAADGRPLRIENLPLRFENGPYLLKSYAFRYYRGAAWKGPVCALGVVLAADPEHLRIVGRESDPFSEVAAGPEDLLVELPLSDAWLSIR